MKMTKRDKMLLVVLFIVLVIALLIVMPNFGIMSCKTKINDAESELADLNEKLNAELADLRKMGVNAADAANKTQAANRLDTKIHEKKVEASRLAGIIMPYYDDFNVEKLWLDEVKYVGLIESNDPRDLVINYNDIENTDKDSPIVDATIHIGDKEQYDIKFTDRTIVLEENEASVVSYAPTYLFDSDKAKTFGEIILYLQQAAEKGSLCLTELIFGNESTIKFNLLMTKNSELLNYSKQLEEEELAKQREAEEGE